MANTEGIILTDQHWDVIDCLRKTLSQAGSATICQDNSARYLDRQFVAQGGSKYLYRLFPGGPVTQGSRLANLRAPAHAIDSSFGTCY